MNADYAYALVFITTILSCTSFLILLEILAKVRKLQPPADTQGGPQEKQ